MKRIQRNAQFNSGGAGSEAGRSNCQHGWFQPQAKNLTYILLWALATITLTLEAGPLDNWHWRNPLPQGNTLSGIAFGQGMFVAVGASGTLMTSADGSHWNVRDVRTTKSLEDITYGAGLFVAVGAGVVLTSTNGTDWSSQTHGGGLIAVAYGSGVFVAVGDNGRIETSSNGSFWSSRSSGTPATINGIAFGGGLFVAAVSTGDILTSPDGFTWTRRSSGTTCLLYGVTWGNGVFVITAASGGILTSSDGINWSTSDSGVLNSLQEMHYGDGQYVIVGWNGTILTSNNAIDWTLRSADQPFNLLDVAQGAGVLVAVGSGGTILTSTNGINWLQPFPGNSQGFGQPIYGHGRFVAPCGTNLLTSPDGAVWSLQATGNPNGLNRVVFANNLFLALGDHGTILTSSNGNQWTSCQRMTDANLRTATASSNLFVALGSSGTVLTSGNGIEWTNQATVTGAPDFQDVTFGNGAFVALQALYTSVFVSSNGVDWVGHITGSPNTLCRIAFGTNTFVAIGVYGTILTSRNLINWTPRSPGTQITALYGIGYYLGRFVSVGPGPTVISSPNGADWTVHAPAPFWPLLDISYGGGSFLLTGYGNALLQSDRVVGVGVRLSGRPELVLTGLEGCFYRIEAADGLQATNLWTPCSTILLTNSATSWLDVSATTRTQRFYRAVLLE